MVPWIQDKYEQSQFTNCITVFIIGQYVKNCWYIDGATLNIRAK